MEKGGEKVVTIKEGKGRGKGPAGEESPFTSERGGREDWRSRGKKRRKRRKKRNESFSKEHKERGKISFYDGSKLLPGERRPHRENGFLKRGNPWTILPLPAGERGKGSKKKI